MSVSCGGGGVTNVCEMFLKDSVVNDGVNGVARKYVRCMQKYGEDQWTW